MGKGEQENMQNHTASFTLGPGLEYKEKSSTLKDEVPINKVGPHPEPGRLEDKSEARPMSRQEEKMSADHAQALERLKARREREPLFYCKIITKWPLRTFLITLFSHIAMMVISAILVASGYDLLPIDFENLPLEINDKPWRPRDLAWTYREGFNGFYDRTPTAGYRLLSYPRANIDLYYDGQGSNVFTTSRLKKIQSIENELTSVSAYQNTYCQLDNNSLCQSPISIIRYFDGTFSSVDAIFNDPTFSNIPAVLYEAYTNNITKADFRFFLGKSHEITSTSAYSPITRSMIPVGFPLPGYTETEEYEKHIRTFQRDHMKPILVSTRENCAEFDFSYRSDMLWLEDVFEQAMKDVLCAFGSICFIFIFILIHTRSLWITGFAVFSIMSCFVITNLIYRVVLGFRYIGFFHVLTLFIVLGIGADDIFVFYDVWRNTAYETYPSLAHRLSDAYRKSMFSMLFTSITTAVAFFASAISPLLATRSFGVFSGLVIAVNYISVIVYFPAVVIMYHTKFEKFKWPCITFCKRKVRENCTCCQKAPEKPPVQGFRERNEYDAVRNAKFKDPDLGLVHRTGPQVVHSCEKETDGSVQVSVRENRQSFVTHISINNPEPLKQDEVLHVKAAHENGNVNEAFDPQEADDTPPKRDLESNGMQGTKSTEKTSPKKPKEKSFMVLFFRNKYSAFVTHKIFRWVILVVMATVLIVFSVQASKLEPDNEGLKVLKESHVYSIAEKHSTDSFVLSNADRTMALYIVWGMYPNNMDSCHFSTPKCRGVRVWDSAFNPSSPEAQTAMKALCDKMMSWTSSQASAYRVKRDVATNELQINCYIRNLDTFLQDETSQTGVDWDLTYDYTKAVDFMNARSTYYNATGFDSNYKHHLEIPISYWLSNRYTYDYTNDFFLFNDLIGEEIGNYSRELNTNSAKMYGNNIRYIAIQVNTTLKLETLGYAEGIPIMNRWEDFINGEMKNMPEGMNKAFQTTQFAWHWLIVSEMLAKNAVYGVIIGVCLALPILVIATGNIISGILATFSMCCSTVCVIGVIPLGGWKLGVLESLNMCMVVGLTVDYVVHLAEGYTLSLHKDRFSRVRDMLDEMAVSVFFGACTTLGASMFMFLAQLSFFLQFGIFMFSTIGFSLFFAMGMFVTLMGLIGPQGDTGNLKVVFGKLRTWCKNRRSHSVPPSESRVQLAPNKMASSESTASFGAGYLPSPASTSQITPVV